MFYYYNWSSNISSTESDVSIRIGKAGLQVDQFKCLGSNISSTEHDVSIRIGKGIECYLQVNDYMGNQITMVK